MTSNKKIYNDLVSVIIPVHNSDKYLKKLLDSVINQTYKNLEIIILLDSCDDNSLCIVNNYLKIDIRLRKYNLNYKNVSKVRNFGIDKSNGDYLLFIDSDDILDINMIEILLNNSKKFNSKISACGFKMLDENYHEYKKFPSFDKVIQRNEYLSEIFNNQCLQGYVWNKLYNANLIKNKNIYFDSDINMMEDDLFNYMIFDSNKSFNICISSNKLYFYIKHSNSLSKRKYSNKNLTMFFSREKEIAILEKNNICSDYLMADYVIKFERDKYLMKNNNLTGCDSFIHIKNMSNNYKTKISYENLNKILIIKFLIAKYVPFIFYFWLIINKKK